MHWKKYMRLEWVWPTLWKGKQKTKNIGLTTFKSDKKIKNISNFIILFQTCQIKYEIFGTWNYFLWTTMHRRTNICYSKLTWFCTGISICMLCLCNNWINGNLNNYVILYSTSYSGKEIIHTYYTIVWIERLRR